MFTSPAPPIVIIAWQAAADATVKMGARVAKTVVGHRQSVRRLERWWVAACGSSPTGMSDDAVSAVASTARMSARHRPLDEAYRDRSTSEAGPLDVEKRGALEEAYHSTSEAKGEAAPTAAAVAQLRSQPSIPLIISRTRRIGRSVRALATVGCPLSIRNTSVHACTCICTHTRASFTPVPALDPQHLRDL